MSDDRIDVFCEVGLQGKPTVGIDSLIEVFTKGPDFSELPAEQVAPFIAFLEMIKAPLDELIAELEEQAIAELLGEMEGKTIH